MQIFDEMAKMTREKFQEIRAAILDGYTPPAEPTGRMCQVMAMAEEAERRAELEAHIEEAGREEVFAHARALGWTGGAPMWVWHAIASEVQSRKMAQNSPKSPQSD
ncbi:hypothetical protein [Ancylobacter polymorphus]|uniref:Uncharacterized protein n=1 Tax=Ancylobacter polymorphus TaxID=223390 RepID=A0ABU0BEH0_9HYPH|nr:hypothetical protein [Ancylobacter polymorphus]MDQ0303790.1 hypothetical protein [Ancylobacter polymorphus]